MVLRMLSVSFLPLMAARAYGPAPGDLRTVRSAWFARLRRKPMAFPVPPHEAKTRV
jgi:hypothetical protein